MSLVVRKMPPKGSKGRKTSKKQKKAKYIPDPDLAYKDQLNAEYYIPKVFREKRDIELSTLLDNAITASTVDIFERDGLSDTIPIDCLGFICGSLGLSLSPIQLEQLKVMTTSPRKTPLLQETADGTPSVESPTNKQVDKKRLKEVLLELLHNRILSYDAQVLAEPDPRFSTRILSIVYCTTEDRIQKCFEALWPACGSQYTLTKGNEKIRCLGIGELWDFLGEKGPSELPLTDQEFRDFVLAFEDPGENLIREDIFLLMMVNVL